MEIEKRALNIDMEEVREEGQINLQNNLKYYAKTTAIVTDFTELRKGLAEH